MLKYSAILVATLFCKVSAVCEEGKIRLVNGSVPNEGRVDICSNSNWSTVCMHNGWSYDEAKVVCRQLGYRTVGAEPFQGPYFGAGSGPIVLDSVYCDSKEATLLDCQYVNLTEAHKPQQRCNSSGGAGVRCPNPLKNVSVEFINTSHCPPHYVRISWELHSMVIYQPSLFNIECVHDKLPHSINVWVDYETFTVQLGRLISSATYYTCCVKAVYRSHITININTLIDEVCTQVTLVNSTSTEAPDKFISGTSHFTGDLDNRTSIVGGVLGFIIAVLLILLAICGGALLFLLRSRSSILKRSSTSVDSNSVEMPVNRNISYVSAPSHSTNGSQATQAAGASDQSGIGPGAAAEYSRIGPLYETSIRQQPVSGRNRVSARLSERYEFSEPHLAMMSAAGRGGGVQGEAAMDYEVPLQSGEHEEYSHLQH